MCIKQVVLNLFQNAMDAIPEAGGAINLNTHHQNSNVYFTVQDNGVGMNEETRKGIFEPFFTTKSNEDGTGLGLWVTQSIIQSHGGNIEVNTKNGKGTSFIVSLPLP